MKRLSRSNQRLFAAVALLAALATALGCASPGSSGESEPEPIPVARFEKLVLDDLGRLPAFSHATIVGDLVFVSGTLGTSAESLGLVDGGIGPQTVQALSNIEKILTAAGSSIQRVAKCNVYVTDMSKFADMNEAYLSVFGDDPPARTTVGVAELALGADVEMECIGALEPAGS